MNIRQAIFAGWFFGVPALLLGLWVGQVGPAADWDWVVVTAPWWIGVIVIAVITLAHLYAFDEDPPS